LVLTYVVPAVTAQEEGRGQCGGQRANVSQPLVTKLVCDGSHRPQHRTSVAMRDVLLLDTSS